MTTQSVKVWDLWVRLTHWVVALGIFANLAVTESGSDVHEYIGYTIVGLVVSRLIWGFIGTKYARFSDFFPTPARIKEHLHTVQQLKAHQPVKAELGHNAFGALMMFALWGVIIALGVTGYLQETDRFFGDDTVKEIHEFFANSLYLLVPIHVLSAIVMGKLQNQNLIKSMITGKKVFQTF